MTLAIMLLWAGRRGSAGTGPGRDGNGNGGGNGNGDRGSTARAGAMAATSALPAAKEVEVWIAGVDLVAGHHEFGRRAAHRLEFGARGDHQRGQRLSAS